jgi:hypothetical protein
MPKTSFCKNSGALALVIPFTRDKMPNTPPRVFDITFSSWNQMNMTMKDCLPSYSARIHADIKAFDGIID